MEIGQVTFRAQSTPAGNQAGQSLKARPRNSKEVRVSGAHFIPYFFFSLFQYFLCLQGIYFTTNIKCSVCKKNISP